jgi:hypothetical protein
LDQRCGDVDREQLALGSREDEAFDSAPGGIGLDILDGRLELDRREVGHGVRVTSSRSRAEADVDRGVYSDEQSEKVLDFHTQDLSQKV